MQESLLFVPVLLAAGIAFYLQGKVASKRQLRIGLLVFAIAIAGIIGGLLLSDRPFMRSQKIVDVWIGVCGFLALLGILLAVPAASNFLRGRRRRKKSKESWPNG